MQSVISLGEFSVDLIFKDIKNIHLSVYPPTGRVRISAPTQTSLDAIRAYAISKLAWIRRHQIKFINQKRQMPLEYLDRESHYLWGTRRLLHITEKSGTPSITLEHKKICLNVPKGTSLNVRERLLDDFHRKEARVLVDQLKVKWEEILGIKIKKVFIQKMKTRWGSCNPEKGNIRLNLDLVKKPHECFEYVFVHELLHFFVPNHGVQFVQLLDQYFSNWRIVRQLLSDLPLTHLEWK